MSTNNDMQDFEVKMADMDADWVELQAIYKFWRDEASQYKFDFLPLSTMLLWFQYWMAERVPELADYRVDTTAFRACIVGAALGSGDWVVTDGEEPFRVWAPTVYMSDVYGDAQDFGLVRKSVNDWCTEHRVLPIAMTDEAYADMRHSLGLESDEDIRLATAAPHVIGKDAPLRARAFASDCLMQSFYGAMSKKI